MSRQKKGGLQKMLVECLETWNWYLVTKRKGSWAPGWHWRKEGVFSDLGKVAWPENRKQR